MKKLLFLASAILVWSCLPKNTSKIDPIRVEAGERVSTTPKPIAYKRVEGDPMNVLYYQLKNGLSIYLSVNKAEPRIQTYITTKAGSVQDPSDATGLAHYLEHMLFKGNNHIGTIDYEKEKVEIDKIKSLYEDYRQTSDSLKRVKIYAQIDSISQVAAQYACVNEFDQLHATIGANGTNAYTSSENTTYLTNIPANQLEAWVKLEAERFSNPVLRLFHTELEAVYEEKNISQDNHQRQMYYKLFENLFRKHKYGTQTTIGTIEHLKNPSMVEIEKYFKEYYVPNNMAIILSGDFNPDSAVAYIEKHWGSKEPSSVNEYIFQKEDSIKSVVKDTVKAPDSESLLLGYRLEGTGTEQFYLATMMDMVLNNSAAGLIDLNINQPQKAVGVYSGIYAKKDYSIHMLGGSPTKGQSLSELESLIMDQIELIKKGDFPDWLIGAIVNDFKIRAIDALDNNRHRNDEINQAFVNGYGWEKQVNFIKELEKISKQDIIDFANKNYKENYVAIYKVLTDEKPNRLKVQKPAITPVEPNRNNVSDYLKTFTAALNPEPIQPEFISYKNEISESKLNNNIPLYFLQNTNNELFNLRISYPVGSYNNNQLGLAAQLVKSLGTDSLNASELAQEMYKLGMSFDVAVDKYETTITLKGLIGEIDQTLKLFDHVLLSLEPNDAIAKSLIQKQLQLRENQLKNHKQILWQGLNNYAVYGKNSPLMNNLSNKELQKVTSSDLINTLNNLRGLSPEVMFYGNLDFKQAQEKLKTLELLDPSNANVSNKVKTFERLAMNQNTIYVVDYDLQQAEILFISKDTLFDKENYALNKVFNEYYGGGMSSIIFQEIREKKALAYSTFGAYTNPQDTASPHYVMAYIGTQADKTPDAMDAMLSLLNEMPLDSLKLEQAKTGLQQQYATDRITNASKLYAFLADRKLGYTYDKRKDVYEALDSISLEDIAQFHAQKVSGRNYTIAIVGNTKVLDMEALKKYGNVVILTVEDLFPY